MHSSLLFFLLATTILLKSRSANAFTSYSYQDCRFQHQHATNKSLRSSSDDSSTPLPSVLCIGETLWDSLPSGIYLGGAPSNVAVHLAYLFNAPSCTTYESTNRPTVAVAACLGNDQLGREAKRRLALNGVRTDYIQFHSEWETGMATALLDSNGDATYEFNTPAAWDGLCLDPTLTKLIQKQQQQNEGQEEQENDHVLFVMGTIAGRLHDDHGATSLSTLSSVRNSAPEGTVIMDINLRSPWYEDGTVLELIRGSSEEKKKLALLKVNEEELAILEQWCGLDTNPEDLFGDELKVRMEQLAHTLNTQRICVTRGEDGAALFCDIDNVVSFVEHPGYSQSNKKDDSDTVGAGDSFLASLINSLFIHGETSDMALKRACALGGYVASCRGATPVHADAPDSLRNVFSISC